MNSGIVPVYKVDASPVTRVLTAMVDVYAVAAAVALNRSVEVGMAKQRVIVEDGRMRIRNPRFDVPPVTIPPGSRATPDHLAAVGGFAYATDDPKSLGSRADRTFSKFGASQEMTAQTPEMPFFAPAKALQPAPDSVVPRTKYPYKLIDFTNGAIGAKARMKVARKRLTRAQVAKGMTKAAAETTTKQVGRYFVLGQPNQRGFGIWQRIGPKPRDIQMLWEFIEHKKIPKLLDFQALMETTLAEEWPTQYRDALDAALAGKLPGAMRR